MEPLEAQGTMTRLVLRDFTLLIVALPRNNTDLTIFPLWSEQVGMRPHAAASQQYGNAGQERGNTLQAESM